MTSLQRSLLIPALLLLFLSLVTLSSVPGNFFMGQVAWIILGIGVIVFFHYFDTRPYAAYPWFVYGIYCISVALLIATYFFAPTIRGSRAWLVLGPLQFQTSEFAKAGLIIILAYFFSKYHAKIASVRTILLSAVLMIIPAGLVILEPDLGSAIILASIWLGFLLISGLKIKHLALFILIAAFFGFLAWNNFLADYQKNRIMGLFNPELDPLGVNFSVIQSKIAIGSAGFFGKGYGQGTQVQLGFLPESYSDFIFAAFIEEWGLAAALVFMLIFVYLILIILKIGLRTEDNFSKFVSLGTATVFGLHFAINIGSTIGLLPVIGVPLTFFSYGGSNLITSFFLLGLAYGIAGRIS
ncbi:MAG: rod shape-determining protein RodA [Candidatus Liptonbacteria bacterium]|nr:rod shape-determining protein RodA [Candidatus Liptonbacteria bacterium]